MTTHRTALRRLTAGVGAIALALVGLGVVSSAASAAEGNIDPDATGSLTIHKYGGGASDEEHDGSELTGDDLPDRPALQGVQFTVCEVTHISGVAVDLTTVAGWEALEAYMTANPVPVAGDFTLGDCSDDVTDVDGVVDFSLDVGLYFVQETDIGDNPITDRAVDFLVTVPFPTGNDGSWNYNPHVYPKNTLDSEPVKEVDDEDAVVEGDVVTWTVTSPVLGIAPGNTIDEFVLTDDLVDQLNFVTGSLTATLMDGATTTDLTDDFDVDYTPAAAGGVITAEANADALAELNDASSTAYVVFTFDTEVVGVGLLENTAVVNVGGTSQETNPAETPWGFAVLVKSDSENEALLDGAEFDVYVANEDGTCPVDSDSATPVLTGLVTGAGDDAAGELTTPALKAGVYCFQEVTAPAGYVLPTGAAAWSDPFTVIADDEASATIYMENDKQEGPDLPLTGAQGTAMLSIGGLLIGAAGVALLGYGWNRNRKQLADSRRVQ